MATDSFSFLSFLFIFFYFRLHPIILFYVFFSFQCFVFSFSFHLTVFRLFFFSNIILVTHSSILYLHKLFHLQTSLFFIHFLTSSIFHVCSNPHCIFIHSLSNLYPPITHTLTQSHHISSKTCLFIHAHTHLHPVTHSIPHSIQSPLLNFATSPQTITCTPPTHSLTSSIEHTPPTPHLNLFLGTLAFATHSRGNETARPQTMESMRAIIELFRRQREPCDAAAGNPLVWRNRLKSKRGRGGTRMMNGRGKEREGKAAEG